jgi:hypothetical protein
MSHRVVVLTLAVAIVCSAYLQSHDSKALAGQWATQVRACSLNRLSVTVPSASAAGGTEGMLIAFRNVSPNTCQLHGYPEVVAARRGASFTAIASASTYLGGLLPGGAPPLVTLRPGSTASVVVAAGDNPRSSTSSPCVHERYKSVTVWLPGLPDSKKLSARLPREATSLPSCSSVEVTPFQKGLTWFAH